MRLYRVLLTPWVATPRSGRWMFVFVLALATVIYALGEIYGLPRHARVFSAIMLGVVNAACWLLLLPNSLFLVLAARQLRLPRISSDVTWSFVVYAVLGIGAPMLCQFPHGHVLSFAIVQVLVATGVMLYLLLPAYVGLALFFLPLLFNGAHHARSWPDPTDPRLAPWGGMLALLMVLLFGWRWAQLLRGDYSERGLRVPNLINLRRNLGGLQRDPLTDARLMRIRPDWLTPQFDLRAAGPQQPITSLRIALGGVYLPQTLAGRLRRMIPAVLILAAVALMFSIVTHNDVGLSSALSFVFSRHCFLATSWLFALVGMWIVMIPTEVLILRWARANAELPLLALLPRLTRAGQTHRLLLRAAIQRPALLIGVLLAVGWLAAIVFDAGLPVALAMLAVALGCLGYLSTMALCVFGGRPLANFGKNLLLLAMFVLLNLTVLVPQEWPGANTLWVSRAEDVLGVAWLLLAGLLMWLARRGWRGMQQRAQPFLAN